VFRPIAKGQRLLEARLTDRSVANIVKIHCARAGLDPAVFSGHSLRSGFLTSAAARGASIFKMMDVSRPRVWTPCAATCETPNYLKIMLEPACSKRSKDIIGADKAADGLGEVVASYYDARLRCHFSGGQINGGTRKQRLINHQADLKPTVPA
jgi:hypothetical protein